MFTRFSLVPAAPFRLSSLRSKQLTGGEGIRPIDCLQQHNHCVLLIFRLRAQILHFTVAEPVCSSPHIDTFGYLVLNFENLSRTFLYPAITRAQAETEQHRKAGAAIDLVGPRPRPR